MRRILTILSLLLSAVAHGQVAHMGKSPVPKSTVVILADTLMLNMSEGVATIAKSVNFRGDPKAAVVTYTHSNGWTVSTIATDNWRAYTNGKCVIDNFSVVNGYFTAYASNLLNNGFFNYSTGTNSAGYDIAVPHFKISGLNPSIDYKISCSGGRGSYTGFSASATQVRVAGATSPAMQPINQNLSGPPYTQSAGASFTLKPNSSGEIYLWVNPQIGTSILAVIAALQIIQIAP